MSSNDLTREDSVQVVVCVVLESTWKNVHTDLIGSGNAMKKSGNFGCISAAPIRRPERSLVGERYWIISAWVGKTFRQNK